MRHNKLSRRLGFLVPRCGTEPTRSPVGFLRGDVLGRGTTSEGGLAGCQTGTHCLLPSRPFGFDPMTTLTLTGDGQRRT